MIHQIKGADESCVGWVEKTDAATHNIAANEYVIWKGKLYKALSDITVGDDLVDTENEDPSLTPNLDSRSDGGLGAEVAKIGETVVADSSVGQIAIADDTTVKLREMTLTKGTWIITGHFQFTTAFDASYALFFYIDDTIQRRGTMRIGSGRSGTGVTSVLIAEVTNSQALVELKGTQNSGASKNATYIDLRAVRIA